MKIRHDNTGMKSAWFLGKVEIEDKLKGQRYVFPCDRWLATNEDDGQISRDLPALTSEDYNAEQKRKMTRRQSSKALVDSLDLESKGSWIEKILSLHVASDWTISISAQKTFVTVNFWSFMITSVLQLVSVLMKCPWLLAISQEQEQMLTCISFCLAIKERLVSFQSGSSVLPQKET